MRHDKNMEVVNNIFKLYSSIYSFSISFEYNRLKRQPYLNLEKNLTTWYYQAHFSYNNFETPVFKAIKEIFGKKIKLHYDKLP